LLIEHAMTTCEILQDDNRMFEDGKLDEKLIIYGRGTFLAKWLCE